MSSLLRVTRTPCTGLWAWARYPNYGGEIVMWCSSRPVPSAVSGRMHIWPSPTSKLVVIARWGIWIMCTVILQHGYWASIASPLFVMLLILKGSGVPLQEKQVCS